MRLRIVLPFYNVVECNTTTFYDAMANKYYCFFFYSTELATRGATKEHCLSQGGFLPHINTSAIWNFVATNVPTFVKIFS